MSDQYEIFDLETCQDMISATSSQASESGATPCGSPDGLTTGKSGQEAAPARPSAPRAKVKGLTTLVTSGRYGPVSSQSAALQSSLENRLMERLDTAGSTLFRLTWKRPRTPLGRRYLERAASARRTEGSDCTSWQKNSLLLGNPATKDAENSGATFTMSTPLSAIVPQLKSGTTTLIRETWPTPALRDYRYANAKPFSERGGGLKGEQLCNAVVHLLKVPLPARLTATGQMRTGSSAGTENGGQLDPAHSRWLMGLPPVFCDCAVTAMACVRRSRKPSSKRTAR